MRFQFAEMAMQAPADPSPVSPWRLRFRLRSLFAVTTALAVFLGLVKWKGPMAGAAFLLVVGIALIVAGMRIKRRGPKVTGVLVIAAALSFGVWASPTLIGVEHVFLLVPIEVRDADTGKPVPNAAVRLIEPYALLLAAPTILTDSQGMARVPAELIASGWDDLFEPTRHVRLSGNQIDINGIGYKPFRRDLEEHVGVSRWDRYAALPVVRVQLKADKSPPDQRPRRAE